MDRLLDTTADVRRLTLSLCVLALAMFSPLPAQAYRSCRTICDGYNPHGAPLCREWCEERSDMNPGAGGGSSGTGRRYGAIAATDTLGDFFGYSYGWGSRAEAEQVALKNCHQKAGRARACRIAIWFYNTCAALAQGADGAWSAKRDDSSRTASANALADCRRLKDVRDCKVTLEFCSR